MCDGKGNLTQQGRPNATHHVVKCTTEVEFGWIRV